MKLCGIKSLLPSPPEGPKQPFSTISRPFSVVIPCPVALISDGMEIARLSIWEALSFSESSWSLVYVCLAVPGVLSSACIPQERACPQKQPWYSSVNPHYREALHHLAQSFFFLIFT